MGRSTVTITVNPQNDIPLASNESYSVDDDDTLSVSALTGVLANDNDVDGDPLTAVLIVAPPVGTLTLNADGSFLYTPAENFPGVYAFTYLANDGTVNSNVATVTITVNSVNDAPTASSDNYSVDEDGTLNITATGVLANDSDIDGDPLSAVLVSGPSDGSLTLNADGSFTYTPDTSFNGTDSFTYQANDSTADSNVATVTITVNSVNDTPTAGDDGYSVNEDNTLNIAASSVLANDSDPDGDSLTAILVSGASNGTLTLNADGSFDYTPDANFIGSDSFTYKVNDGTVDGNTATVTITVNGQIIAPPTNDAPPAGDTGDFGENILPILDDAPQTRDDPVVQLDPIVFAPYGPIDDLFSGSSPLLDFPDSSDSGNELGESTGEDGPELSQETSEEGEMGSSSEPAQEGEPVAETGDSSAGTENLLADSGADGFFEETVGAVLPPEVLALLSDKTELSGRLEEMSEGISDLGNFSLPELTLFSTTLLTAGYVLYDLRKLCFIFTAMSSIPHWREFDLLSVLNTHQGNDSNSKRRGTNPLLDLVHGG